MKILKRMLAMALIVVFVASLIPITGFAQAPNPESPFVTEGGKIVLETLYRLENFYIRPLSQKEKDRIIGRLIGTINEVLQGLDPYSYLVPPKLAEMSRRELGGEFYGIGVKITVADRPQYIKKARSLVLSGNYELGNEPLKEVFRTLFNLEKPGDFDKDYEDGLVIKILEWIGTPEAGGLFRKIDQNIIGSKGIEINEVFAGSPAQAAGLKKGWFITEIDGAPVRGLSLEEAVKKIKGPEGTTATFILLSPDQVQTEEVPVKRGRVEPPVLESKMLTEDIGYIKLEDFKSQYSDTQLGTAIDKLKRQGMEKFIFDLRDNPGGALPEADQILEMLLRQTLVEYSTKFRTGYEGVAGTVKPGLQRFKGPLVILINGRSASASELVAGSVQDHKRGKIIGTRSFGKGVIQSLFDVETLPGKKFSLHLTTGEWFTPLYRSVHGVGVIPDILIADNPETAQQDEVILRAIEELNKTEAVPEDGPIPFQE